MLPVLVAKFRRSVVTAVDRHLFGKENFRCPQASRQTTAASDLVEQAGFYERFTFR